MLQEGYYCLILKKNVAKLVKKWKGRDMHCFPASSIFAYELQVLSRHDRLSATSEGSCRFTLVCQGSLDVMWLFSDPLKQKQQNFAAKVKRTE
jgi:hypothetical protein